MKRGDLVTVALQGEQGKPRPALVVQADRFADLTGMTVLPITGMLLDAPLLRVEVEPSAGNGLAKRSQIMVDKPQTPPRGKVGVVIGHLDGLWRRSAPKAHTSLIRKDAGRGTPSC